MLILINLTVTRESTGETLTVSSIVLCNHPHRPSGLGIMPNINNEREHTAERKERPVCPWRFALTGKGRRHEVPDKEAHVDIAKYHAYVAVLSLVHSLAYLVHTSIAICITCILRTMRIPSSLLH